MAFFQNTVTDKYLNSLDKLKIQQKFVTFKEHFHNPEIQENIRNSKEEQYQEGFLRDLFVNILGYTLNPQNNFNLTTEYKNIKDSKKADGAIIIANKVLAVIELKGTETTDLGKIETQAFGYKNNQPDCIYIITSNFEKLRFYIDNAIEHLEFNLFTLTEKQFELLYLCLAHENIEKGIPKKIKEESISQEDTITKKLYKDYSLFKRELHQNLVQLNPEFSELDLFKKSQKLLDRFLFLFFAEDRKLLPPNSVRLILNDWRDLQERDVEIPLFERFKKYFGYLNTGHTGKRYDVFAYNGGLFKPDDILDVVKIDDELLYKHTLKLSEYDFASEVDVNILGHIFENSLNELDEIKAQLEGQAIDKTKTKRKKDGVFYTPKYITKYIVENTIGKLCTEKKQELEIHDEDYTTDIRIQKKTKQAHFDKLKAYREWLLQLTICDPACGSGAFLNQALDFLIAEHRYIDELQAKLFGDSMVLSDVEKSILENNIFGVDLNEESVEIAKLSLWLRTAQPNRTLNNLNNNIQCGNSLIDDTTIAGDKAFNWQQAFPQVFAKGGFDVVIGNPPYGAQFSNIDKQYYSQNFNLPISILDTYLIFIKKSLLILKNGCSLGFIIPSTWLYMSQFNEFRKFLIFNYQIPEIILYRNSVFESATVETCITLLKKSNPNPNSIYNFIELEYQNKLNDISIQQINIDNKSNYSLLLKNSDKNKIFIKIAKNNELGNISKIVCGLTPYRLGKGTPNQTAEIVNNRIYDCNFKKDETYRKYIMGRDFNKYIWQIEEERWISYGKWLAEPRYAAPFDEPQKIIIRQTSDKIIAHIDTNKYVSLKNVHNLKIINENIDYKFLLSVLNSKLLDWWYQLLIPEKGRVFAEVKVVNLEKLPIKISINQQPFIEKADQMLSLNKELQEATQKFQRTIQRKFEIEDLPTKLQNWYALTFKEFIAELGKKKIKLTLAQESEWEEYFLQEQTKALAIKNQIDSTDKEIDRMVYELYELTEDEIKIIEAS